MPLGSAASNPPKVQQQILTTSLPGAPIELLELLTSSVSGTAATAAARENMRAYAARQSAPAREIVECVLRAGAEGLPLPELKNQLGIKLRTQELVGRTLKAQFLQSYLLEFPQFFRVESVGNSRDFPGSAKAHVYPVYEWSAAHRTAAQHFESHQTAEPTASSSMASSSASLHRQTLRWQRKTRCSE